MKLRWNCEKQGCFNRVKRPKIEVFDDCLPGKIEFGDMDGIVEIKGRGLVLEYKPAPLDPEEKWKAQWIMWKRLTRNKMMTAIVVAGDSETMNALHAGCFWGGKWSGWVDACLEDVRNDIKKWAAWAQLNPLV